MASAQHCHWRTGAGRLQQRPPAPQGRDPSRTGVPTWAGRRGLDRCDVGEAQKSCMCCAQAPLSVVHPSPPVAPHQLSSTLPRSTCAAPAPPAAAASPACAAPPACATCLYQLPTYAPCPPPPPFLCCTDELGFTLDELERFTFWQCFLYCRCTKPVRVCPALYYAGGRDGRVAGGGDVCMPCWAGVVRCRRGLGSFSGRRSMGQPQGGQVLGCYWSVGGGGGGEVAPDWRARHACVHGQGAPLAGATGRGVRAADVVVRGPLHTHTHQGGAVGGRVQGPLHVPPCCDCAN